LNAIEVQVQIRPAQNIAYLQSRASMLLEYHRFTYVFTVSVHAKKE